MQKATGRHSANKSHTALTPAKSQIKGKILFNGGRDFTNNGIISYKCLENSSNSHGVIELKYKLPTLYIKYVSVISEFPGLLHQFL